ncbi:unnamed protein product [Clavelina lepadiformis]|uniref:Uncharacterized protein n=1 Tax=Clavelina lepadiformis TaxID=159417 RepID=A0ABP0H2F1_CLALP
MSINLNIHDKNLTSNSILHHLPCKIQANEEANVKSYFKPKKSLEGEKQCLSATFRGRPLDGKDIALPEGYVGVIVMEKNKPFSEEKLRSFDAVGCFKNFTQWYLDSQYTSENSIDMVCQTWATSITSAIHSPIDPKKLPCD